MMKRILAVFAALLMTISVIPAQAEDVCGVDAAAGQVTTASSYICVYAAVEGEQPVTLSITNDGGELVYQRDYGLCSGSFASEDIYLKLNGASTNYCLMLDVGGSVSALQVTRVMARLTDNAACSVGYPLSAINGSDTWKSVTLLDTASDSTTTVPLHASGAYTLGTVSFTVQGGSVTVSAALADGIDGSIDQGKVYVATTALSAQALATKQFTGASGGLNTPISLDGAALAAVYVRLTVSFDPTGVAGSPAVWLDGQDALWQRMLTETATESVG